MKPLIVGVDPGSTSAVAAVDLDGEIELLESGKNFPPREIIQRIVKVGRPVVVTSDKGKTPSKVDKIASSVGARLFEPEQDLSSEKKKELGKGANSHELDAVASAVHARKQLHRDIRKINSFDQRLERPKEEIASRIFNDEPVTEKEDEEESVTEKPGSDVEQDERDPEKRRMETEIENLREQVQTLKSELGEKESCIQGLEDKLEELREEDRKKVVKDREVKKREAVIKEKQEEIERLESLLDDADIREKQYRKALNHLMQDDHDLIPLVDAGVEEVPEVAATRDNEVLQKLEARGAEVHHVDDLEGVELGEFMVVESIPETKNFESIIQEYRESR